MPAPETGLAAPSASPVKTTPGRHGGHAVNPIGSRHARTLLLFFNSAIDGSSQSRGSDRRNSPNNCVALIACQFR